MNDKRLIVSGLIAGIVLSIVGGVANGTILGGVWQEWLKALGPLNHAPSDTVAMLTWSAISMLLGLAGLWLYSVFTSTFGPGPASALKVAVVLWICAFLTPSLGNFALGAYPLKAIIINCLGGLLGSVLAMISGAAIYRKT